jgi:hypothetical protein
MKQLIVGAAAAAVTTVLFGTVYVTGQQILRLSANEPQTYQAQLVANQLNHGATPESLTQPKFSVDSGSLAPFIIIYNHDGKVVASQVTVRGSAPVIPIGVLHNSDNSTYHAVTWQPTSDVRLASITVRAKNYYVVAARSLVDVEHRTDMLGLLVAFGWGVSMIVLGAAYLFQLRY